jgi:hypothetical protein
VWAEKGANRFYFSEVYNRRGGAFEEVPKEVLDEFFKKGTSGFFLRFGAASTVTLLCRS